MLPAATHAKFGWTLSSSNFQKVSHVSCGKECLFNLPQSAQCSFFLRFSQLWGLKVSCLASEATVIASPETVWKFRQILPHDDLTIFFNIGLFFSPSPRVTGACESSWDSHILKWTRDLTVQHLVVDLYKIMTVRIYLRQEETRKSCCGSVEQRL